MNRGKIVAIITGAIAITIAIAYLFFVLLLDTRGEMKPAPITQIPSAIAVSPLSSTPTTNY
ncbi:MAG: hypothetical protein BRC40_10695 [Cyanobacteria bacterium QH_8_48_120]|nr:MAG: hypothetical protein BRC34_10495 [Cyanobacteria bacterium QH_1_48_107]PSO53291.1 MAG: hypothetical protein BRC35_16475 [Cyanobacteria bacterium QH_10_48_56]PSO63968.1 MAG: hypothetical protein BRC39_03485 [Cyanobacteria bacterium QH_7_48_89]PSO67617.1 MAG: hypothetical protein BRC38_02875 [Cyanobacteria bacterium QH_6_48_35]PSO69727.1 MAG: hypothetical protein BRC42_11315 [Cyanobacteria bacterium QS_1_48_34]PSO71986.1 MAG: hypothetical protein BRC40_10695 [Cyanobacteria bacterium QH_8_